MNDKPDLLEKVIRFICGAILGAVFGLIYAWRFGQMYHSVEVIYIAFGCFVLVFGILATLFGDAFWRKVFRFPWT